MWNIQITKFLILFIIFYKKVSQNFSLIFVILIIYVHMYIYNIWLIY